MTTTLPQTATGYAVEKLAYTADEIQSILGISPVTRWRYEKRGLLKAVPGIRHKLYSRKSVDEFLAGKADPVAA